MKTQSVGLPCMGSHLQPFLILLVTWICLLMAGVSLAQAAVPRLSVNSEVATAGFFRLSWEADAVRVELQQAANPEFHSARTLYIGPDRATVISGKPDGVWYYRMRTVDAGRSGQWSESLAVTVSHHSLGRAVAFFALGVVIFLGILVVVVRGARQSHGRVVQ